MHRSDSESNAPNANRGQMLASYARAQVQRAAPCETMQSASVPPDSPPGYTLHREVHRGGQGVVFEATQHSTKRRVALKIMHEVSSAGVRRQARFEREIEILAQLRHPNVVAVHDGGVTAGGRFYLAMDFIDGESIDDFLASRELSVRETVSLFLKTCEAVKAAHLRGVVHRDLKPGNIRVDRAGEPHVLDFGLAKVVESDSGRAPSAMTKTGEFIGTLHWASPEQAEGAQHLIDTRSDVYSLGVLLFHALTGSFPYGVLGSMSKVLASIKHADPARPSCLRPEIDDDVDTIILKCLSKQPERRYQSAGELARDLQCYLNHQPIEAKRDSTWYVLTRTIRRHRIVASFTTVILVGLIGFLVTTTVLYRRAAVANAEALEHARRAASIHREWVSHASFVAEDLANELVKLPESMPLRRSLLESTLGAFAKLQQFDERNPEARVGWARTQVAMSKMALAVDRNDEALEYRKRALAIWEQLTSESPANADYNRSLALSYVLVGDLLNQPEQVAEKQEWYERAFVIDQALVARFPDNANYIDDLTFGYERLGDLFKRQGDVERAQEHFAKQRALAEQLVELAPARPASHWALFCSLGQQAAMFDLRGDGRQAAQLHLEMLEIALRLQSMGWENSIYAIMSAKGSIAADLSEAADDGAMIAFLELEPLIQQYVAVEPHDHDRQRNYAGFLIGSLANFFLGSGDHARAAQYAHQALKIFAALPPDAASHPDQLKLTMIATEVLARVAFANGDTEAQQSYANQTIAAANTLESMFGSDAPMLDLLSSLWANCDLPQTCDPLRAEKLARRSISLNRGAGPRSHYILALALKKQGQVDAAVDVATHAMGMLPHDELVLRGRIERLLESLEVEHQR